MEKEVLEKIIDRYLSGSATLQEKQFVEDWLGKADTGDIPYDQVQLRRITAEMKEKIALATDYRSEKPVQHKQAGVRRLLLRLSGVAAAVLLFFWVGAYFFGRRDKRERALVENSRQDVFPGGNKAILTLASGEKVMLTSARNGALTKQGNTLINKIADGKVAYTASGIKDAEQAVLYNTISTPRGGKYDVILPDGTLVSLDAESSIRFPTAFTGDYREVSTTGQVYFEVARNIAQPFRVASLGQLVEVLGTHFNINAYQDEAAIRTTLVEGSIKVIKGKAEAILTPGQQAWTSNREEKIKVIPDVAIESVIAWKNGYFSFQDEELASILRQFSRWYDVKVVYEGSLTGQRYNGKITRAANLSRVLRILQLGGVNFRIQGNELRVSP